MLSELTASRQLLDLRQVWPERLARVRASQGPTDTSGMTRVPRDPDERTFLEARGHVGPFRESPGPKRARDRR